jgi:hypothetical protein
MATSITHEDVKPRIGVPTATTTYDTELDTICTACAGGVDAAIDASFLTSAAAAVKLAAIDISAGSCIIGMMDRPGYAEVITAQGVAMGGLDKVHADKLIKAGWDALKQFLLVNATKTAAEVAALVKVADSAECDMSDAVMVFGVDTGNYEF